MQVIKKMKNGNLKIWFYSRWWHHIVLGNFFNTSSDNELLYDGTKPSIEYYNIDFLPVGSCDIHIRMILQERFMVKEISYRVEDDIRCNWQEGHLYTPVVLKKKR